MGINKVLYRTAAIAKGGREGRVGTEDGALVLGLAVPGELGGAGGKGNNPEQLFAAGYAACFQSALLNVAAGFGVDLTGSEVRVGVALGPTGKGGMGLAVEIELAAPGVDREEAVRLMQRAHRFCPYSQAIQGNVEVDLRVFERDSSPPREGAAIVAATGPTTTRGQGAAAGGVEEPWS